MNGWLPTIIKIWKESLWQIHSEQSNNTNLSINGEVNRLVGWALFASIKKYKKIAKTKMVINSMLLFWKF